MATIHDAEKSVDELCALLKRQPYDVGLALATVLPEVCDAMCKQIAKGQTDHLELALANLTKGRPVRAISRLVLLCAKAK